MSAAIDDTYAEAFRSIYAEVLVTAADRHWLDTAARRRAAVANHRSGRQQARGGSLNHRAQRGSGRGPRGWTRLDLPRRVVGETVDDTEVSKAGVAQVAILSPAGPSGHV